MKIANKISISFLMVGAVLTTVAGSIFYTISKNNLQNAIFEHLKTATQSRAHHIEGFLNMQKEGVTQLSNSVALESFLRTNEQDLDYIDNLDIAVRRLKETEKTSEYVYEVFVLNAKGKAIASSDRKKIGLDRSTDAYFGGAKSGPYIKDAYFDKTTGQNSIAISAPITDRETKELLGVVVCRISLSMLNEITADRTGLGKTGEIYLINKHGYMITPSRFKKDTFLKLKVDTENTKKCLEDFKKFGVKPHEHEPLIYTDYRGFRVLGLHDHIPEMQWGLLAKINESEAFVPLKRIKAIFLIIIVFVPLVAWLTGIFIARLITGPIRMLHEGTEIIGQGNLDYKVSTYAKDEIGQLSRAFDKMTGDLKKTTTSINELNKEIAERKLAEEKFEIQRAQIKSLFDYSGEAMALLDLENHIIDANLAFEEVFGYPLEEAHGKVIEDLICPERFYYTESKELDEQSMQGIKGAEIIRMRKDGKEINVRVSAGPIKVGSAITGRFVVFDDITERKQAEEAWRKAAALETLIQGYDNFIGDSLSNLLTPIYGYIELCEMRDSIDEIKGELGNMKGDITKLLTGISAYRKFTKAEESSLGKISSVDISSILDPFLSGQSLKTYGDEEFPIDPKVKLQFTYNPKQKGSVRWEELPSVSGSKLAVATTLQETLINAVESYDPKKGGDVVVSARREDGNLIIKITDNGRGMSNEERDKSQLPFFKILGIKGSARLGLGAYITRQSAKYCGGDIHIESREGVGTTASISFKVSDEVS
jgi:PAS domain S-box-containing protein